MQLDDASRVEYLRRGPIGDPIVMAKNLRKAREARGGSDEEMAFGRGVDRT